MFFFFHWVLVLVEHCFYDATMVLLILFILFVVLFYRFIFVILFHILYCYYLIYFNLFFTGEFSFSAAPLTCSVPQGSILGPMLFLPYT